ncbi:MAG: polyprenyl synthetase family protein [Chitinispirillaceae bacterium]|nr:polyprenyl synthetase family protein [Chitinispirillaceae bacterium]
MNDLTDYMKKTALLVEEALQNLLPQEGVYPPSVHRLIRYSTFAGGKRIRPCLLMAAYEACGRPFGDKAPVEIGAAIEMFHTFSLIHDDLPCMDDDDFRRGKPTAHKAFNEALAVLGGDALCIIAFEVFARYGRTDIITEIACALGTDGMIGGQVVDIESEGKTVDQAIVEYIHSRKTAALIRACIRIGALLADADADLIERLSSYGKNVGLAFQVIDDILDEESTTEQLGKDAGSDRSRGKATFPSIVGMEESKQYARQLIENACRELEPLGVKGTVLKALAEYIRVRIF